MSLDIEFSHLPPVQVDVPAHLSILEEPLDEIEIITHDLATTTFSSQDNHPSSKGHAVSIIPSSAQNQAAQKIESAENQQNFSLNWPLIGKISTVVLTTAVFTLATKIALDAGEREPLPPFFSGITTFTKEGAIWGAAGGLAASIVATPFFGYLTNMHKITNQNVSDCFEFIKVVTTSTIIGVGGGALAGANDIGKIVYITALGAKLGQSFFCLNRR